MLDAYLKNGELFLKEIGVTEITPEAISGAYLKPINEMTNGYVYVESDTEAIAILRRFGFELSGKTKDILSGLTKGKKGTCSICGKKTEVVPNRAFIFPFERKIDSIVDESNRLSLCSEHAFKLYSAMAYLYTVPTGAGMLKFFFDAPERDLKAFKRTFKDDFWRRKFKVEKHEKNGKQQYSIKLSLALSRYHPNEAFFAVLHEFVKFLKDVDELEETIEAGRTVRTYLIYGSGQFYREHVIEGTTLEKLIGFLDKIQEAGKEMSWGTRHLDIWDSAVVTFYESLEIPRGKDRSKNYLEREEFVRKLLEGRFDFVLLNTIFMERLKRKLALPPYYYTWAHSYLEVFGGGVVDVKTFEQVNGLGYSLGMKMRGTNLERYQWELFRARGFEEFLNKLVELQAKLEESLDLRPVYENQGEWKVVKAVLLNGMLNALHGQGKKDNSDRNNPKEGSE
ncbi:hypothetical protein A3L11_09305 [Thermococcus siculi]|uniref:Type I-B CRISPR-associated protein Cas8b1/Cst1 n=1 Tax=Thermococcus siculi TaxID=72803 RepID=A0A2Z2MRM8_9EURY|nr:hypothetical protein [Thermococcus siculi]ASJ09414.1 hypothetical protein A3L11_09305 [Thermococcus siculi]